ncbi:MAG: hypothetical protein UY03_C0009G0005 [Parcubacteria group bacterium GW2011_GWA2_47_64]|nr:MAG: hypothetical protein UY03_C0009G0005 [Parcubacteria group bacterium GW2011_GWA2_47_64]KKU96401.1 MAG: hypothetical protein UY29_C0012G0005 [Parcubacteria group bacterium GW2011_GWC2_48_17]
MNLCSSQATQIVAVETASTKAACANMSSRNQPNAKSESFMFESVPWIQILVN